MYTTKNYKSKKEIKADIVAGVEVTYYQPGPFGGNEPKNGAVFLEGPHYPAPHRWYASAVAENGRIVRLK
jgi:hypothetical protein